MGLDMYLSGSKTFHGRWGTPSRMEDGLPVEKVVVTLGYWRKHWPLHNFIVGEFAEGVDECQEIELTFGQINEIIDAVKEGKLEYDTGDYSQDEIAEYDKETLQQLGRALMWKTMDQDPPEAKPMWKTLVYVASW
jgi:hypothetical protein